MTPSDDPQWVVLFRGGPMTDELRAAIAGSEITLFGSGGGGFAGPGGELPEMTTHTVIVRAPDEQAALDTVRQAVEGVAAFGDPTVRPVGENP